MDNHWGRAEALIAWAAISPLDEHQAAQLADLALDHGREEAALPFVAAAAARHDTNASLWQWTALLHRALDQHGTALLAYERAQRLRPEDPRIAHGLARTMLEGGLPAVGPFERAAALSPHDGEIQLGLALARSNAGRAVEAIAQLERLLNASPGWLAGHDFLARLYWTEGETDRATGSIERALVVAPQDPRLWRTLMVLLIHAERFEDALAAGARARAQIGDHIVVLGNEACALSELGRAEQADTLYARIGDYDDISIAVRHIRHLLRNGRIREAAVRAETLSDGPGAQLVWPYLSLAWRLLSDPRWEWLEGDETLVGVYDLRDSIPPIDVLADKLRALHIARHQPLDQSLRGGTQSDGTLFQHVDPIFAALRSGIANAVRAHIDQLSARDLRHPTLRMRRDRSIRFSGSWSVRLTGAGFHANHIHHAGWLSSALHVVVPGTLPGDDPHAGWLALGVPQRELGLDLPPTRMIEPRPGHLVLFPSTMWHGTRPFPSGERMTVAFDVAAPGY